MPWLFFEENFCQYIRHKYRQEGVETTSVNLFRISSRDGRFRLALVSIGKLENLGGRAPEAKLNRQDKKAVA